MQNSELTISSMKEKLISMNVPASHYRIGGYQEESLCLVEEDGMFCVFEGERGGRHNVQWFSQENDACNYFLKTIVYFL